MGQKIPSDGCWDLIRGRDRTMIDRAFAREKEKDVFIQDALAEPSPRGFVITEISSAQGDKNSASSAQKNSHSWHKD
jgi:hypothetical protein